MGDSVEARIQNIIQEELGVDGEEVTRDATFTTDLGCDSLDVIEIVMKIEEEFHIEIPDEDYDEGQLPTVGHLIDYVEQRLKKAA